MLGGWVAVAAFVALVLLADGLVRHCQRPRTVLLVSAAAGLVLGALGSVLIELRVAGSHPGLRGIGAMSFAGLAIGLLVGAAFAGLGEITPTHKAPRPVGADGPPDPERPPHA